MNILLRVNLLIAISLYFLYVIISIKKNKLEIKHSLLWLFFGIVMFILVMFPQIPENVAHLIGIEDYSNGLFSFAIFVIIIMQLYLTMVVSDTTRKIKQLIQEIAILEERVRNTEKDEEIEKC